MLEKKLARHMTVGRLTIRGLGATDMVFGTFDQVRPNLDVTIRLRDRATAWKLALYPELYLGESYMSGALTIERGSLRDFIEICFLNFRGTGSDALQYLRRISTPFFQLVQQWNSRLAARRNVAHHYDLSEELYSRFLDADRQYSCAYFEHPDATLEEAQRAKKAHILDKLLIEPGQRALDIGCGWGGLALDLARRGASHVTGVTLSAEQLSFARQRAIAAGLDRCVRFELQDYRDTAGPFDRIVSVGMFEHVGTPNYQNFFDRIAELLTENGVAVLHSIGSKGGPGATNAWIRKHIFPGGYIPALSEVLPAIERAGLWVTDIEILRLHYAETLRHWQVGFSQSRADLAKKFDEEFCRMWEFYLATSEMGFRHDGLMVFQIQLAKRVNALPITRDYMVSTAAGDGGLLKNQAAA